MCQTGSHILLLALFEAGMIPFKPPMRNAHGTECTPPMTWKVSHPHAIVNDECTYVLPARLKGTLPTTWSLTVTFRVYQTQDLSFAVQNSPNRLRYLHMNGQTKLWRKPGKYDCRSRAQNQFHSLSRLRWLLGFWFLRIGYDISPTTPNPEHYPPDG